MAAIYNEVDGVRLLLKYGADKDLKTRDGFAAFDLARAYNAPDVVALLMGQ